MFTLNSNFVITRYENGVLLMIILKQLIKAKDKIVLDVNYKFAQTVNTFF